MPRLTGDQIPYGARKASIVERPATKPDCSGRRFGATGTPLKLGWNMGGARSTKTCNISETAQDGTKVTITEVAYALSIGTKINDLG